MLPADGGNTWYSSGGSSLGSSSLLEGGDSTIGRGTRVIAAAAAGDSGSDALTTGARERFGQPRTDTCG